MQSVEPTQGPPAGAVSATNGEAKPQLEPPATVVVAEQQSAPTAPLPGAVGAGGVTAWVNSQTFNALWSINQTRNAYVGVTGVGWKKLANNSDSAIMALSLLSAHAREKNATVNYREEADGMIHEMYVW